MFKLIIVPKYQTLSRRDFVEYFTKQNHSWRIAAEPHDNGFVGCINFNVTSVLPTRRNNPDDIKMAPENFDSRTKWPQCKSISRIPKQGGCGSCWTFGVATTASDRTCIHKNVQVNLSEQDFECLKDEVCKGIRDPGKAFQFWKDNGLVTQECKPYDIKKLLQNTCTKACVDNSIDYNSDKHFASKVYSVNGDAENIKAEIYQFGSIEAGMQVYEDFAKDYQGGIYEHTHGKLLSGHSVRLIGYGVEDGIAYWLGANSWGENWGEGGFFRIK